VPIRREDAVVRSKALAELVEEEEAKGDSNRSLSLGSKEDAY